MRRGAIIGAVTAGTLFLGMLACNAMLSRATRFCPLDHRLDDLAVCYVLDRQGDRLLIQHGDLDTNEFYLEVRRAGGSRYFQVPVDWQKLVPIGYSARLVPGDESVILVDGRRHALQTEQR